MLAAVRNDRERPSLSRIFAIFGDCLHTLRVGNLRGTSPRLKFYRKKVTKCFTDGIFYAIRSLRVKLEAALAAVKRLRGSWGAGLELTFNRKEAGN